MRVKIRSPIHISGLLNTGSKMIYENGPCPYSTETLVYKTDADNADVMAVSGIGKMYKAK